MKTEVKVPSVGESITTGTIVSWLKKNGEAVQEGDILFELETDKAVLEIPSPGAGTLEILIEEDEEVEIGQTVATLSSDAAAEPTSTEPAEKPTQAAEKDKSASALNPVPPKRAEAQEQATPPAEPRKTPDSGEQRTERVRMTAIRKRTAERLVQAKQTAAYLTTFNEIDMQKVIEIRTHYKERFQKEHGIKIGFMSFFVKACCQALKEFQDVNAQVESDEIVYNHFYDIGVAMSIERGLIVPIIRDADTLHFAEIEKKIADFARRAQEKKLSPDELTGGTFTITNGGVFGSLSSTPIPAYPQSAILGMHAIKKRPVVIDDEIVIRPMMYVALSYDHRVIDGREAVSFLVRIKEFLEDPDKLLLEL